MKVELKEIKEAPNLKLLKETFGVKETEVIISYGNFIYAPNKTLSKDLLVHELTHCERQGFNERSAEQWWKKYMEDVEFRLKEEAIAYRQQYLFCCRVYKDRNKQAKILHALSQELSAPRYGSLCSVSEAKQWITQK